MINTEKLVINKKVYETIRKARHVHEFYTYKDKPVDKEVMKDKLKKDIAVETAVSILRDWDAENIKNVFVSSSMSPALKLNFKDIQL